jgi:hypothetical protein
MQPDTWKGPAEAAGLELFPAAIVACGVPREPAPRLLALQSAVAKGVGMLAAIRAPNLHLSRSAWLRPRAQ